MAECSRTAQPTRILQTRSYKLKQFFICGAGIKITVLLPNILKIKTNDPRQGRHCLGFREFQKT